MAVPRYLGALLLLLAVLDAQTALDNSGNSFLNGDYFFRYVALSISNNAVVNRARALSGIVSFNGNGTYSVNGQITDTQQSPGQATTFQASGTYVVASNGLAEIQSFIDSRQTIFSAVGGSAVVGSSTESTMQDVFIAVPAGAAAVNNSSLQGVYRVASLDFPGGRSDRVRGAFFSLSANGQGALSDISVAGNAANLGNVALNQTVSGATYSLSGRGNGALTFPIPGGSAAADQRLIGGDKLLYLSNGGDVLLGGAGNGFDILVGIRAVPSGQGGNALLQGTYYTAGLMADLLDPSAPGIAGFYGSVNANGKGTTLWHQRLNPAGQQTYDYTTNGATNLDTNAIDIHQYTFAAVGAGGQTFIETGDIDFYEFTFGVKTRPTPASGVFLNPIGIVNSASFAPITNPIAPGEFITLYGSGFGSGTASAQTLPLPTTLSGVQVSINGRPAPLYYVSPEQVSALVPYATQEPYAKVQVTSNGTPSNPVTVYTNVTAPAIFTTGASGAGPAAIQHANFSPVSSSNPARHGETVLIFATGLGLVDPAVADGAAAPSNPLSRAVTNVAVFIDNAPATVSFVGLAPRFAGVYQINCQVPQDAGSGDVFVDISAPGAYHSQATINIAP